MATAKAFMIWVTVLLLIVPITLWVTPIAKTESDTTHP